MMTMMMMPRASNEKSTDTIWVGVSVHKPGAGRRHTLSFAGWRF